MWTKSFSTTTKEVTKVQIWKVLTDINNWNSWDNDIEWTKIDTEPKLNANFFLKPKGGPKTRLTISEFNKPNVFADVSHLPLAKMVTTHHLSDTPAGLKIEVTIQVTGLLSFLWSKVIAQKQIDGGLQQTEQLIEKAKTF